MGSVAEVNGKTPAVWAYEHGTIISTQESETANFIARATPEVTRNYFMVTGLTGLTG